MRSHSAHYFDDVSRLSRTALLSMCAYLQVHASSHLLVFKLRVLVVYDARSHNHKALTHLNNAVCLCVIFKEKQHACMSMTVE